MEIDMKDLEGATLMPLDDGRLAYIDKSGAVIVYGLPDELLANRLEVNEELDGDPGFILTSIFPDQCGGLVLSTSEDNETIENVNEIEENPCQDLKIDLEAVEEDVEEIEEDLEESEEILTEGAGTIVKQEGHLNILQVEDDCVEQVTVFKCRACLFTAPERLSIVNHFAEEHLNSTFQASNTTQATLSCVPVSEEFERLAQSITADSQDHQTENVDTNENEAERLLFLCVECQGAFESIELCRQHMIQEHKFVSGRGKSQSKLQGSAVSEDNSSNSNLPSSAKNSMITIMDVGGLRVEWQPVESSGATVARENSSEETLAKDVNLESDNSSLISEDNAVNTPKLEVQKVKERARKIKCSFRSCVSKFSSEKALQTHMSCHSKNPDVKTFHCIHCDEEFIRWRLCSSHLWRVHKVDVDLLACPVCQTYKAATPLKLEIHLRTHGDLRPFRCTLCPKSFKQSAQLRNHCTSVHFDKKSGDANPRWYMEQQCNQCGKTYSDAKSLKRHIQAVHSKMKPYVCAVCGHSSACKAMLALHMRQHTGEKPHACTHCDYRTGDHNTLRRHIMRHTGQRRYKCPYCSYSAIQSNCYKAHLRTKHPGESGLFSCSSCSFQTISQDAYVQHIADHQKGLITPKETLRNVSDNDEEVEYFPGNVAAAHLVYRYLGTFLQEPGRKLPPANITDSQTSADGTTQSITIQIPSQDNHSVEIDDDESSHSFLHKDADDDVGIDTGGITIPAEPCDLTLVES